MVGRIVFITTLPISRLFSEKVGLARFKELGFEIILLDASPQYHSWERIQAYYSGDPSYSKIDPEPILIRSKEAMLSVLKTLGQGDVVWHLSRFFKSIEDDYIFEYLEKFSIPYYLQHFDTVVPPIDFIQNMHMQIRMWRQKYLGRKLKPCGIVGSGLIGRRQCEMLYPRSRFLSIPSVKVMWNSSERLINSEYILFVDESVEYAPDAKLLDYSVSNDVDGYYTRMNQLFTLLETSLGKTVVIAASGKYKYLKDRFQGRSVVYGKTLLLIQHASLVIGHMSLALEQCIVSEVPFLIVDDQSFSEEKRYGFKESLLYRLKNPILNTSVTQEILLGCANLEIKKMRALVKNFLKEECVTATYYDVVAADFEKSLASDCSAS